MDEFKRSFLGGLGFMVAVVLVIVIVGWLAPLVGGAKWSCTATKTIYEQK